VPSFFAESSEKANGCKDGVLPLPTVCFQHFGSVDLRINDAKCQNAIDEDLIL
jgi:hypothetical protein